MKRSDHIRHGVLRGFAFSPITASARSSSRSTRRSARCSSANSWRGSASAFRFCTADSARRRARRRSASSMLAHTRSGRPSFSRSRRRSFRFGMSKKRYPVRIPQFAAGIRVQESRTGSSGRSWRAKRWTEILEGMGLGGRLGRGKERQEASMYCVTLCQNISRRATGRATDEPTDQPSQNRLDIKTIPALSHLTNQPRPKFLNLLLEITRLFTFKGAPLIGKKNVKSRKNHFIHRPESRHRAIKRGRLSRRTDGSSNSEPTNPTTRTTRHFYHLSSHSRYGP